MAMAGELWIAEGSSEIMLEGFVFFSGFPHIPVKLFCRQFYSQPPSTEAAGMETLFIIRDMELVLLVKRHPNIKTTS